MVCEGHKRYLKVRLLKVKNYIKYLLHRTRLHYKKFRALEITSTHTIQKKRRIKLLIAQTEQKNSAGRIKIEENCMKKLSMKIRTRLYLFTQWDFME